jgi:4-amino-4-deoxy-L-arabinose transferase-like glycosyltransferase
VSGAWRANQRRFPAWVEPACLGAVLALAALLRFYNLWQRGLVYWDEGKFALEGARMEAALHSLLGSGGAVVAGKAVGTAKPTHALLIGLAYAILGVHDYAALYLDAACSVAAVGVLYIIARRLFSVPVAMLSALFLAVSEYDIIYARSVLSESDANLIMLCGVLVWIGVRDRIVLGIGCAGLLMGLAFTANYRLIVYIVAIVGFDLLWTCRRIGFRLRQRGWVPVACRAASWIAGLLIAPLAWQLVDLVTRAHGLALFRSELTGDTSLYVREAIYQLHQGKQSVMHFNPLAYLRWYVWRSGLWMLVLLLAGIAQALWHRRYAWLAMAVPVVVPFLIYAFAPFIVPRNLDAALPFASVLVAAAAITAIDWIWSARTRLLLILAVAAILGAAGAAMSWRLTGERSGYAQAAIYVERHDPPGGALASNEIVVFYLRGNGVHCQAPNLRSNIYRLAADVRHGYRYAILDHFSWQLSKMVRARMPHVARIAAQGSIAVGENLIASENGHTESGITPTYVNIYRLEPGLLPPPGRVAPDVCNRERV